MQVNTAGLDLIKKSEGFRNAPYKDSRGRYTEGYGHTKGITAYSPTIDEKTALEWLEMDVMEAEALVKKYIKVPLTDNQFSALVVMVFNCGEAPLMDTLGCKLNAKDYDGAADEFERWDHVKLEDGTVMVVPGLLNRRKAEKDLFLQGINDCYV